MKKKVFVVSSLLVIQKSCLLHGNGSVHEFYGLVREHTGTRDHSTVFTNQLTVGVVSREYTCSFQSCFVLQ